MTATTAQPPPTRHRRWDNARQRPADHHHHTARPSTRPAARPSVPPDRNQIETTPPMPDDDRYWEPFPDTLSTTDVAKILSLGKPAVLLRLKSGLIPGHLIVGSWIIFKAEVRAWLESTSNQIPPGPPEPVDVLERYADEMSYSDLMELFGKSKATVYGWLHDGEIPAFHVGTRWIIRKSQLRQKLANTSNQKPENS